MNKTNIINSIIKKYNALSESADVCKDRHLDQLMAFAMDSMHVEIDGDEIVVLKAEAPFHRIEIERIIGAEELGQYFAIVLPASAILIHKTTGEALVSVL